MSPRVLAATLLLLLAALPAQANYACAVKRTGDGFVALRDGPSARHAQLARMRPQELVGLLHPEKDDIVQQGDWVYVSWYPGTRRTAFSVPDVDEAKARKGWVHVSLINCFQ
jgi:hypothetical protein